MQTEATGNSDDLKSNTKTERANVGGEQSVSIFVPFATVLGAKANKIPKQGGNQVNAVTEASPGCYSENDNCFQPELFDEMLRESFLGR